MKKGLLFVLSGPSGAGKGSVLRNVLKLRANTEVSVSCTTRAPRPGEKDGVHYYFKTHEEFKRLIKEDQFLEYAQVFENYYGTPLFAVNEKRERGIDVILEIDVQGALNVRKKAKDAVLIFIAPPSLEELARRLRGRQTETEEQIALRLGNAEAELAQQSEYDHVVVNIDRMDAAKEVITIMDACKESV